MIHVRSHPACRAALCLLVIALPMPLQTAYAVLPSFPGAEGYGNVARGGRGGRIIPVTTLADSGPGSLRACLEALGPRVCIFRVGGVIRYTALRPIIRNPYITVAGETAPGGGILITHNGGVSAFTPFVIKDTHDVIVRDIRVRMDRRGAVRGSNSAITIENGRRIMLDHVSTSWSLDENIGLQGQNDQITISNSILAEGVLNHSKCALLASDPRGPQRVSFIRNLCASNGDRNPNINFRPGSCVEIVNNLLYNAKVEFAEIWESNGGSPVSIVGNYFRAGPNTSVAAHGLVRQTVKSSGLSRVYETGNLFDGMTPATLNFSPLRVPGPPCPLTVKASPATDAYARILSGAGAFPRDAVDRRLVSEVVARGGRIVSDVGTLPPITGGAPYADSDGDGMSDAWEKAHGLNPTVNDAWGHTGTSPWSNLERFLAYAHQQRVAGITVR
jgi:pectate lyase